MARWPLPALWRRTPDSTETKSSLAYPDAELLALFGAPATAAGVAVTPDSAMRVPAVRAAVQAIAETAGLLPLHTIQRGADGSKQRASEHPVEGLLRYPNDWTTGAEFREQVTRDALLHGNAFAFANRVGDRATELIRLDPTTVTVAVANGEPTYTVGNGSDRRTIARGDILHIRAPGSRDGVCGVSPIRDGREAIGLALILEQHAARLFSNGARPSGVISLKGSIGADALARAKAAWQAAHSGSQSGGTAILPADASWEAMTFNSVDSQFLELRTFAVSEIARLFRVPPILLGDYSRATWGNAEEQGRQFLTYCLLPWLRRWTGELGLKLFSVDERQTFSVEFVVDDLLRADIDARADAYTKLITARVLNPNEARAMENRPPYAGGDRFENPNTSTTRAAA
jgi:HK97 family phage portal protein